MRPLGAFGLPQCMRISTGTDEENAPLRGSYGGGVYAANTDRIAWRRREKDFLPLNGTDYVEFYVGNARQAAYYYRSAFGMRLVAYRGPETGTRDRASYVLEQDKIRLVLTTPLIARSSGGRACAAAWRWRSRYRAVGGRCGGRVSRDHRARRARACASRRRCSDEHGEVRISAIATYGDTIHSFVERRNYSGVFLPGFVPVEQAGYRRAAGGLEVHRPHGGQRRLGRDEHAGWISTAT